MFFFFVLALHHGAMHFPSQDLEGLGTLDMIISTVCIVVLSTLYCTTMYIHYVLYSTTMFTICFTLYTVIYVVKVLGKMYSLLFTVLLCLVLCILYATLYKTLFTYSRPYRTRVLWTIHHPAAPLVLTKPANILRLTRFGGSFFLKSKPLL